MSSIMQNAGGDKSTVTDQMVGGLPPGEPLDREPVKAAPSLTAPSSDQKPQPGLSGLPQPPESEQDRASSVNPDATTAEAASGGDGSKKPPAPPAIFNDPEDLPEFLDDLERQARGSETRRQVRFVEPYIRAAREKGIPIGRIFDGLSKRQKITIGKTQFDKICRSEFPDLF